MLHTTLKATGATAVLAVMLAQPVLAQTAPSSETPTAKPVEATAPANSTTEAVDDAGIVVVGSRIARDVFSSPSPIQLITREETTLAGFANTAQALQGTAVTGGSQQINNSFGGFVTDGGPGANTLSLRGLGAFRTLILINGRRVAPAGTRGIVGSADLNVLPSAIVDRTEILKDGASSIYGSDAIAGVVNIVTRKKIDGVTLEGFYSGTGDGGGAGQRYSLVTGATGDRFNLAVSMEYAQQSELTLGDREWTQCNTDYRYAIVNGQRVGNPGDGDFIDPKTGRPKCYPITSTGSNGVTINTFGSQALNITSVFNQVARTGFPAAPAGFSTFCNRWSPNPTVAVGPFPGFECVSGIYFDGVTQIATNLNIRDTFDPRALNRQSFAPAKAYNGFVQGSYDLQALGDAEVYFELLGSKRKSSQVGYRQLSLDYNRGSVLIPAALAASNFSGPNGDAAGVGNTSGTNRVGVRTFIGFGNDKSSQSLNFIRFNGGIKGNFPISGWKYDLNLMGSWSDATYTFQSFITSRLKQSLNAVSNGAGGFRCVDTSGGCVAAPALTGAVISGQLPKDWVDYVFKPVTGRTKYNEYTAAFGLNGPVFNLPYGEVKAAVGAEYRKSHINDTPAAESQAYDLYNLTASAPTLGSDSVIETYGEIELPLLKDVTMAKALTLNVSARYSDYKSYGGGFTYKIGGIYSPTGWLTFRGSYGTSYRAPNVSEQYAGATSGFLAASTDPCNQFNAATSNPILVANCRAEGLAPGFSPTQGITVISSGGASAGLTAETSKNLTLGTVFQPSLPNSIGSLELAVDYYKTTVNNGVDRIGGANILSLCYNDPEFRAGGGYCRLIAPRVAGSNALSVRDSYINVSKDVVRGIDVNFRYSRDIGEGVFRINALVTRAFDQASQLFPEDILDDFNGSLRNPKWSADASASYRIKKWTMRYGVEWIGKTESYTRNGIDPLTSQFVLNTPDYFLHNMSLRYKADKFEITVGVRNMFDKAPPQISSGIISRIGNAPLASAYDYLGRRFFLGVTKSF